MLVTLPGFVTRFQVKMKVNTLVQVTFTLAGREAHRGRSLMRWSFAPNRWTRDTVTVLF